MIVNVKEINNNNNNNNNDGLICRGAYIPGGKGGAYTRGNNKISNFNLAISTFLVM